MRSSRPYALSIAGLDPSGGAGLLADIKTFEQSKVMGLGVCTAITAQNESRFDSVRWIGTTTIKAQLEPLFDAYKIDVCKFGLVQSADVLLDLIAFVHSKNKNIQIVVDPVLKASAGFDFHPNPQVWKKVLPQITLLTPNTNEAMAIGCSDDAVEASKELSRHCHIYLKGGHDPAFPGTDHLMLKDQSEELYYPKDNAPSKHGSGCILSAAIVANLSLGEDLKTACQKAKTYTEEALKSNTGLLSHHQL